MNIQKKIIYSFITLVYFFLSSKLFSITIESNDISDLIPHLDNAKNEKNTLILFDIDDTLIDSPISLNSGPWINYYWQNVPKFLPKKMPVIEELMWHVSKTVPSLPVDPTTAAIISLCQKHPSLTALAFTARPTYKKRIDGIKVTANQLLNINIDFSQTSAPLCLTDHSAFHAGIIYTSGKMKGDFLKHFLSSTGHTPSQIIFIDDKLDQIQSVEMAMHAVDIKTDCFWYRRASSNRPSFNLQLSNIQLEHLLKHHSIMTDEEALQLTKSEKYLSIPPEDFLKQLIEYYEEHYFNKIE